MAAGHSDESNFKFTSRTQQKKPRAKVESFLRKKWEAGKSVPEILRTRTIRLNL